MITKTTDYTDCDVISVQSKGLITGINLKKAVELIEGCSV